MPEEKDKANQQSNRGFTRRESFVKLGLGSLASAGVGVAVSGYEFLSPNVLYEPSPITDVGKADQYPQGSVTADPKAGIYIIHGPEGFYSLSAVCTHLGCLTTWAPELGKSGLIACPCHGSKFDLEGTKVDGPAPRPLPWFRMWISDEGNLMVDRSTTVPARQYLRT
ncbi:MAG TPA: ubiquinol-cytochrome c reductase iron-sulfur subunit [Bryobacteraceae bacterium]|nr:ubiquinol-cytochrome c reductase iron-sulfur subunit [Bryobacteraceae bacterium]HXR17226.1 ubiquinol-cytochrome c reductase iron-sulfur subunit [Terriglobales bacterium]HZW92686.1 ubiquinol-cytochrome c reductase iron-sulfur subunit [Candidatus Eremiobacteraceae bacterium]